MRYKEMTNEELFNMVRRGYAWLKWHKPKTDKEYKKDIRYQQAEKGYKLLCDEAWYRGHPEISLRYYNAENTLVNDLTDEEIACIFGVFPSKPYVKYNSLY